MIALTYLSAIRFSGSDAGEFLHNQLSTDVLALANRESGFACYCEPKGRVLALMLVTKIDDHYYVILSNELVDMVSNRLKIYVMRSKVEIEVLEKSRVLGLQKAEALGLETSSTLTMPVPGSNNWFAISPDNSADESSQELCDAWKASELQAGISWLGSETSGQFLPQMLGFDQIGAVNYRKGCYPGQEIVARTHYLGKIKRHPRVLSIPDKLSVKRMNKVQLYAGDQKQDAVIVDSAFSDNKGNCLFVVTRMAPEMVVDQIDNEGVLIVPCPV
jgi:folate-binding protein YgfZ